MGLIQKEYLTTGVSFIAVGILFLIQTHSFWLAFPMLMLGLVNSLIVLFDLPIFKNSLKKFLTKLV